MAHRELEEVREELRRLSGNHAEFYDKLNPTAKPSAGVRVPDLRKLAKELAKEDYQWFLEHNPMDTFELEMLQGLVIGYAKDDVKTILAYLKKFIPHIHKAKCTGCGLCVERCAVSVPYVPIRIVTLAEDGTRYYGFSTTPTVDSARTNAFFEAHGLHVSTIGEINAALGD